MTITPIEIIYFAISPPIAFWLGHQIGSERAYRQASKWITDLDDMVRKLNQNLPARTTAARDGLTQTDSSRTNQHARQG